MDGNEHLIDGIMCKELTGVYLRMSEVVHMETRDPRLKTWFRGTDPKHGIWVFSEIYVIGTRYLPFDEIPGTTGP